jgi:CO/xanthine dehydrogenase Mo-binding subunit
MQVKETPEFVSDIAVKGALNALTIRSTVSRGILKSVDCPRMPPSYTLIRAADIPGKNQIAGLSVPVLARDAISYFGEPLAILVGPEEAQLEEFAAKCIIRAEEEIPAFSLDSFAADQVFAARKIAVGEEDINSEGAASIISGTYRTGIQEHWYAEPVAALALYSRDDPSRFPAGKLLIHTATQWPFHVRDSIAQALKLDPGAVLVEALSGGDAMDGKLWYPSLVASHAALASWITRHPVRILLTREEDFRYSPKRAGTEIRISSALDRQGRLLFTEVHALVEAGSQAVFADEILDRVCLGSLGSYRHRNVRIAASAVKTNVPPEGPYAGFGLSQGFFAMERHVSRIADSLNMDPAEWRKANSMGREKSLAFGAAIRDPIQLDALLDTTASMSDYHRKWASYELLRKRRRSDSEGNTADFVQSPQEALRGIGIACAYQGSGFMRHESGKGNYSVDATLDKEGVLEIRSSIVPTGEGALDIWRAIAMETLSLEADAVRIVSAPTDEIPNSGPDTLSRTVTTLTRLVERACGDIKKQRFRDPLPITVRRVWRPSKAQGWDGQIFDPQTFSQPGWGAAVVEVELYPFEYAPKIRGVWLGIDAGKLLSEERARSSLKFSTIQALGWASREQLSYVEGQIPLRQVYGYDIPGPQDIPPVHIDFIWNDTVNPKGIGELPFSCVPAAYAQAVSQALDHPFEKIPVTARDVWEALNLKKREEEE